MNAIVSMQAAPAARTFEFEGEDLRTSTAGGNPIFRATDVARMLGYRDAGNMTRNLDPDETTTQIVSGGFGEDREVTYLTEPGLYRAIMLRRAVKTLSPETAARISRFQRWATHDVIPTIRRTGSYTVPGAQPATAVTLLEALRDPEQAIALIAHHAQATITARAELASEQEAHAETHAHLEDTSRLLRIKSQVAEETGRALVVAREELAEAQPMIAEYRRFRATGNAENLRTVARNLAVDSQPEFFQWLRDRKFIFDEGGWIQAKASMLKGKDPLFVARQFTCPNGKVRWQTLVTPRGQGWLHDRWEARKRILARQAIEAAVAPVEPDLFDDEDVG